MLLTRAPLVNIAIDSFDLHVLSTPPAFTLSQDQTLQKWYENSNLEIQTQGLNLRGNEKSLSLIARDKLKRSPSGTNTRAVRCHPAWGDHCLSSPERNEVQCLLPMEANPTRELGFRDESRELLLQQKPVLRLIKGLLQEKTYVSVGRGSISHTRTVKVLCPLNTQGAFVERTEDYHHF